MSAAYAPSTSSAVVGYMTMPADFKYKDRFLKGRPRHRTFDDFWRKHPPMDPVHRAKLFAPFDALAGFDEAIASKLVIYEPRKALSEGEKERINKTLSRLRVLTGNGKTARLNRPEVTVTFFQPCTDINSEWYGTSGTRQTLQGTCRKVDDISGKIIIDDHAIRFDDIISITEIKETSRADAAAGKSDTVNNALQV